MISLDHDRPCSVGGDEISRETCVISVEQLTVMAKIGVYKHEKSAPQPLIIRAHIQISSPTTDDLGSTFDYCDVRRHAEIIADRRIALIETFARCLAEVLLSKPMVTAVDISIVKPLALEDGIAGCRVALVSPPIV